MKHVIDPKLDLVLERHADVSPAQVWKAWTRPEQVSKWFAPRPWTTAECEIDLRPGGQFKFVMRSPEGQLFPSVGCYLEVVPNERLVWTDALLPGFRPSAEPFFTAVVIPRGGRERGPDTRRSPCIGMRRHGRSTRRWASTRAGARCSTR